MYILKFKSSAFQFSFNIGMNFPDNPIIWFYFVIYKIKQYNHTDSFISILNILNQINLHSKEYQRFPYNFLLIPYYAFFLCRYISYICTKGATVMNNLRELSEYRNRTQNFMLCNDGALFLRSWQSKSSIISSGITLT